MKPSSYQLFNYIVNVFVPLHVYDASAKDPWTSLNYCLLLLLFTIFLHGTVSLIKITKEQESDLPTGRA